jgi:Fungal specific transcription factor domain
MTFARLILAVSINEQMPRAKSNYLPSRPAAMALVQYYLDNVFSLLPAFPETALFNALDAIYQTHGRAVTDSEHWLLYMVLGIGALGQSRSCNDAYYKDGVSWVARALKYADVVLVPGSVTQIQALILLVEYSMLDPAHFDSWQLIGFACRALVDLGFHQDPPKELQPDKKTLDLRRKIFYCVYSLDRYSLIDSAHFHTNPIRSISMVHARSFSFTDDSTSVAFPSTPAIGGPTALVNSKSGPHSLDAAMLLFQLRRVQSNWYQELFQSSRDPLKQSSTYIWEMCQEMRSWSESFPKSLPPAIKGLFELELLYSYVYCLAPSCRVLAVSELGKTLIFEYSLAYMSKIFPVCKDPINTAFYTFHDALRVYFIGSQLLAVLSVDLDQLLQATAPYTVAIAGAPLPPAIPNPGRTDNIDRSITCIEQIIDTLKTYGERWDDSKALQASFESQAAGILSELHRRQQHQDAQSRRTGEASDGPRSHLPPNHVDRTANDEWAGLGHTFTSGTILQGGIENRFRKE